MDELQITAVKSLMDTDLVEKIRNRVRKVSDRQMAAYSLTDKQLEVLVKMQSYWRMTLFRTKYKKKLKRKEKRRFVILELEKTEQVYINDMRLVVKHVMREVEGFMDEEMFRMLFINLEAIIDTHQEFYERLAFEVANYNCNTTKLSTLILALTPKLRQSYYTFCLEYSKSNQILRLLNMSNTQFKNHITTLKREGILKGELASYLIKPVQRICKYTLLLRELIKYTDQDHPDFHSLEEANQAMKNIVQETNDKIEEFLCQERLNQLQSTFHRIADQKNRFVFECKADYIDKEKGQEFECEVYIFTNFILMAQERKEVLRFPLDENSSVKDAPTGKYFKNIIYVTNKKNTLTLACPNTMKKNDLLEALRKTFSLTQKHDDNRVDVDIEGAEERDSTFSKYTVYIVNIKTNLLELKIFPRFSELIQIQSQIRKQIPHIEMPHLERDGWIKTRKTKTIEKRMFIIKDFLLNILNDPKVRLVSTVFSKLGLDLLVEPSAKRHSSTQVNTISVNINIAGWQQLNIWVGENAKITDLKQKIASLLKLEHPSEYQVFYTKDRMRKLIYQDQKVFKNNNNTCGFLSKMFQQKSSLSFMRYFYLSDQEQDQLYKKDTVRVTLELAIIRAHLQEYKMDFEILLTVMALYAKHLNVQISNENKLKMFLSLFKHPEIDQVLFRQYCYEIQETVQREATTAPSVIIKVMNQLQLYKASQYQVESYPKTLKELRKEIRLQESIILAIKPSKILFLTTQRILIHTLEYHSIKELLVYPTSVVFTVEKIKSEVRFDTVQSFEISKLINHYSKSSMETKHFDYRTSLQ